MKKQDFQIKIMRKKKLKEIESNLQEKRKLAGFSSKLKNELYIKNVEIKCADTGEFLKTCKDKFDVIILDPPRKGCDKTTLDEVMRLSDDYIIYVSCNPATLARDLNLIYQAGIYNIKSIQPYDMFPQTKHVETLAILTKK